MRLGFTGSQAGMTLFQKNMIRQFYEVKPCSEFIHGDCIGADAQAANIMVELGVKIFSVYPPTNNNKRAWWANAKKEIDVTPGWHDIKLVINDKEYEISVRWMPRDSYMNRNKRIVDNCDWMIGAPKEHSHSLRSGTWSTIRYSWKIKRDITVIPPIERDE